MKKIVMLVLVGLLSWTHQAMAHADHKHKNISESAALDIAKKTVVKLTQKDVGLGFGKLPASWAELPAEKIKLHNKGAGHYIVSATNDTEAKILYVLISSEGEVYDANFTGEFQNISQ
jgi:hypothetical protein